MCLEVGTRVSNELVATHSKNTHDDDRLEIDFFFSHKTASAHFYPTHASINLGMKKLKTWLKLWDFMKNWRNRLSWAVGQCQIDTFDFWHNLQVLVWIKADSSYQTSTMNLQILEIGEKVTCFKVICSRWMSEFIFPNRFYKPNLSWMDWKHKSTRQTKPIDAPSKSSQTSGQLWNE